MLPILKNIIKNGLKRLEAIDNAKSSEALECLEYLGGFNLETDTIIGQTKAYNTIKQALIKSQEQEKVLELIKEKCFGNDNLYLVNDSINYNQYLEKAKLGIDNIIDVILKENELLTEKEFELLKKCLS